MVCHDGYGVVVIMKHNFWHSTFWKEKWLAGGVLFIVLLSFLHFSFYFTPILNSDSALTILIAHYFHFPEDLYCWAQDRGGSLISMLALVLHKISGIPLILTASFIHYVLLVLGYFSFAFFLKNPYIKFLLAVLWFLPPWQFVGFLLYPFGIQYSLFSCALFLMYKGLAVDLIVKRPLYIVFAVVLFILMIWVSDFALVLGNPAKQIGWVCECGERLLDDLTCGSCDRGYRKEGQGIGEV